jgi:hypothetical protein
VDTPAFFYASFSLGDLALTDYVRKLVSLQCLNGSYGFTLNGSNQGWKPMPLKNKGPERYLISLFLLFVVSLAGFIRFGCHGDQLISFDNEMYAAG